MTWSDNCTLIYGLMNGAAGYCVARNWHGWTMFWGLSILALVSTNAKSARPSHPDPASQPPFNTKENRSDSGE